MAGLEQAASVRHWWSLKLDELTKRNGIYLISGCIVNAIAENSQPNMRKPVEGKSLEIPTSV